MQRQNSIPGKDRLGRAAKQGDTYLRRWRVIGTRNVVRSAKISAKVGGGWIDVLSERRRPLIVAVAAAGKLAWIIRAMIAADEAHKRSVFKRHSYASRSFLNSGH